MDLPQVSKTVVINKYVSVDCSSDTVIGSMQSNVECLTWPNVMDDFVLFILGITA